MPRDCFCTNLLNVLTKQSSRRRGTILSMVVTIVVLYDVLLNPGTIGKEQGDLSHVIHRH